MYLQFSCFFLHRFAIVRFDVLRFDDQVLSPGFSLATGFLGVVPLWRVAQRNVFQPCSSSWFYEGGDDPLHQTLKVHCQAILITKYLAENKMASMA